MRKLMTMTSVALLTVLSALTLTTEAGAQQYRMQCANGQCRAVPVAQPRYVNPVYRIPAQQAPAAVAAQPVTMAYTDPLYAVNNARARRGLHALVYDPGLTAWAQHNNAIQRVRGLGHHATGGAAQCAAIGTPTAQAAVIMWTNSPSHAALMFSPSVRVAGLAVDGYAATLNLR